MWKKEQISDVSANSNFSTQFFGSLTLGLWGSEFINSEQFGKLAALTSKWRGPARALQPPAWVSEFLPEPGADSTAKHGLQGFN